MMTFKQFWSTNLKSSAHSIRTQDDLKKFLEATWEGAIREVNDGFNSDELHQYLTEQGYVKKDDTSGN